MTPDSSDRIESDSVFVSVHIAASPSTVWKFLSDGPRFASWIGAYAGQGPMEGTKVDPRVGGEVKVAYPGGNFATGKITSMEAGKRIVFSWGYEQAAQNHPADSSQIEITLTAISDGTRVQLSHTGLPSEEVRQGHLGGWKHYLSMLAREAAAAQHDGAAQNAFDAYFKAWAESDSEKRMQLLSESCDSGIRVRTSFACTDGLQKLSDHISGSLKHMPGFTLKADKKVQHVHGHARVPWVVNAPNGQPVMSGVNVATLSLSGKLASVVSFPDPGP
jgi:uncharacterized protein YndB with AHSA1/START domain